MANEVTAAEAHIREMERQIGIGVFDFSRSEMAATLTAYRAALEELERARHYKAEALRERNEARAERDTALAELATLRREVERLQIEKQSARSWAAEVLSGQQVAELTELRHDRERLEWLEHTGPNGSWEGFLILYYETDLNGDLREAIDACMTDVAIDAARAASEGEGK